jgi:hypothetical protein
MRIGIGQIHRRPTAPLVALVRRPGMGQVSSSVQAQLQSWLQSLQASTLNAQDYAGSGCGSGGNDAPCASPTDAANSVYSFAAMLCQENANTAQLTGGPTDPNCGDNGNALAASMYPQLLALFNGLPSNTWSVEQSALAAGPGSYQCSPGMTLITSGPLAGSCGLTSVVGGQASTGVPSVPVIPQSVPVVSPQPSPSVAASTVPAVSISPAAATAAIGSSSTSGSTAAVSSSGWGFLTETSFDGIPNWALIAAGIAAIFLAPKLFGGSR